MPKETEIKLYVSRETLDALAQHPIWAEFHPSPWQQKTLFNQYFDTLGCELSQAGVALRVRRDGESYIQTLKTNGCNRVGLSERNEWSWPLSGQTLDLSRLDASCWPDALAQIDKQGLQPVFTTDFIRRQTLLTWQENGQTMQVELALDDGNVIAEDAEESITELELELLQGTPSALIGLARRLAEHFPLSPSDISKAERGYRLIQPDRFAAPPTKPELSADMPVDEAISILFSHLLGNALHGLEHYRFTGHRHALANWLEALDALQILISGVGPVIPRASARPLRAALTEITGDWRQPILEAGQATSARDSLAHSFRLEQQNTRWGRFALAASAWAIDREWTHERTTRAERQALKLFKRWLPRQLADEAKKFPLATLHRPGVIDDQQPRLHRLLFWLQFSRHLLDLPEIDRLYGELSKLERLSRTAQEPSSTIETQSRLVAQQQAWKALMR